MSDPRPSDSSPGRFSLSATPLTSTPPAAGWLLIAATAPLDDGSRGVMFGASINMEVAGYEPRVVAILSSMTASRNSITVCTSVCIMGVCCIVRGSDKHGATAYGPRHARTVAFSKYGTPSYFKMSPNRSNSKWKASSICKGVHQSVVAVVVAVVRHHGMTVPLRQTEQHHLPTRAGDPQPTAVEQQNPAHTSNVSTVA